VSICSLRAPVAFIIFNRPEITKRVFEAIRSARPSKLLIIADGPRLDILNEFDQCAAAREVVEHIDWPCEVLKNYSDVNMGCRQRLISGLDWVFVNAEEAIILEDDCLPDPSFFPYCDSLLERYRHDERIALIRGDNWPGLDDEPNESYRFTTYPSTWGWATWRRVWHNYDGAMSSWKGDQEDMLWLQDVLGTETMAHYWNRIFKGLQSGLFDTWDLQLVYTCWRQGQLSTVPSVNLVSNIGGGEGATHTKSSRHPRLSRPVTEMPTQLVHPMFITNNRQFDRKGELRAAKLERLGHALVSKMMGMMSRLYYR
jgi:hypothetical protein